MECNITFVKGDTFSFGLVFEELDQDLESAYLTIKESYDDETPVIQKSLGDGIEKLRDGEYTVRIAPDDSKDVDARRYYWDLQVSANSDVFTIMRGICWIKNSVTE